MSPIYEYICSVCGGRTEVIRPIGELTMKCICGEDMKKQIHFPAMIIMKGGGGGGYPSRRKYFKGTAPNTSRDSKEWNPYTNNAFNPDGKD